MEYRIHWNASSNASFKGHTDWEEGNEGESLESIERAFSEGGPVCQGLELALEASGFDWWVETR